jgi:hypothetical protein
MRLTGGGHLPGMYGYVGNPVEYEDPGIFRKRRGPVDADLKTPQLPPDLHGWLHHIRFLALNATVLPGKHEVQSCSVI